MISETPEIEQMVEAFERGWVTRRQLVARLAMLAAGTAVLPRAASAAPANASPTFEVTGLNHIALNVADIPRSRDWYGKHLGLQPTSESSTSAFLRCGPHFVALFRNEQQGMNHYCYTVEDYDPAVAVQRLRAAGLDPDRRGNRVYFKDPDGIEVQLAAPNRR